MPAFDTYRIFALEDFSGTLAQLLGSYFELDVPDATIASGYKSHRLRGDALQRLLQPVGNTRRGGPFYVTHYATTDAGYTPGDSTLADLANEVLCLYAEATVEFGPAGQVKKYVVRFDGDPGRAPGAGLLAYRDGTFTGTPLPAKWGLLEEARAFIPYGSVAAGYAWPEGQHTSAYVGTPAEEQYFKRRAPGGPAPAPVDGGDPTYWEPSSYTAIPPVGVSQAAFTALEGRVTTLEGRVGQAFLNRGVWTPNTLYQRNDFVTLNGVPFYRNGPAFTSGAAFDLADWTPFGQSRFNAPDYANEATPADGTAVGVSGRAYALDGVTVYLTSAFGTGVQLGRISGYRATGSQPSTLAFDPATPGPNRINGQPSLTLAPGRSVWLRNFAGGYETVVDTGTGAANAGPWPSFTNPVTDDGNKLFRATLPDNFRTGAAEYTLDGGATTTVATEAQRSGNVLSAPVTGNKAVGQVGWHLRADAGRPAGPWLFNTAPFTALVTNVVWQHDNAGITYSAGWAIVSDAAALGGAYRKTNALGATATLTVPAGVTSMSLEGYKDPLGSYFTLDKNGSRVVQTDQYDGGTLYNAPYLTPLASGQLAVAPGDVLVFTRTKSDYTADPGSSAGTNANNYFNQVTFYP